MRALTTREDYIQAMHSLAKAAPAQWLEFVERFNAYTLTELEQGVGVNNTDMALALGMNRRMVDMRNDFRNVDKLHDRIYKVAVREYNGG